MDDKYGILIVDHGSRRSEANATLAEVARLVQAQAPEGTIIEIAHMELAEPTLAQGFSRCVERGATLVIVHPFMLAPGRHVTEDIPRLVAAAAQKHDGVDYRIAEPLGTHPALAHVVLDRCTEAAPNGKLTSRR